MGLARCMLVVGRECGTGWECVVCRNWIVTWRAWGSGRLPFCSDVVIMCASSIMVDLAGSEVLSSMRSSSLLMYLCKALSGWEWQL
jgi:hypothetical protein